MNDEVKRKEQELAEAKARDRLDEKMKRMEAALKYQETAHATRLVREQAERERKEAEKQARKPKRDRRTAALEAHPAYWHRFGDVMDNEPFPTVRHKRPWLPTIRAILPDDHPAIALGRMRPGATYHQLLELYACNADVRVGVRREEPPAADQHAEPSPDWRLPEGKPVGRTW